MSSSEAHPPDHGGAVRAAIALAIAASGAGVAIWLARASVEIAAWPAGGLPRRVALHAPLSVLWLSLAFSAAAVAGAWWAARRGSAIGDGAGRAQGSLEVLTRLAHRLAPLTALWLWVVPFLPWLPDRCPLLLLLAGPIRWVLAAGAAAVVARSLSAVRGASWAWTAWRPGRRAVFVLSLVCYAVLGLRSLALIGLDGDEPHYLVITHSLLVDHDLQIENNHARGDYRAFFNRPLNPDYIQRGANGAIYSIHAPGLPAVLLPGYAAAGAMGAVLTMCLLAALAALAIFDVALAIGGPVTAWLTWAGACLTVPFIPHAWSLYPEMAAAAIVAWTVAWMVGCAKTATTSTSARTWMLRGLCLAWLPWLHTKFAILLAGLVLWLLIGPCRQRRDRAALLTPIALSGAAWLAFFAVTYGTLDPQAPYGLYLDGVLALANIPRSLVGMLVDQKFGLLIFAPVFVLGLFGAGELWRRSGAGPARGRRLLVGGLLAIPLAYWAGTSRLYMWWGGASAPARFLVPIVPLLAPLVAAALVPRASRARRAALVIVSVAIAAGGLVSPAGSHALLLFSDPHGTGRLLQAVQGSAPLTALLPTFTEEAWLPELAGLWPWLLAVFAAYATARVASRRARRARSDFWSLTLAGLAGLTVAAVATGPVTATARAESAAAGRFALLTASDPGRLRAFDEARWSPMTPQAWLAAAASTFVLDPSQPADEQGRLAGPLTLPPGRYEARVWFEGTRPRSGDLLLALGRGYLLRRFAGPLPNPAVVAFDLPVAVPQIWVQLTDVASAQGAVRAELAPIDVVPQGERWRVDDAREAESFEAPPNAYMMYANADAYPEGGVFWTRATARAEVVVAPAGAREIALSLHIGPVGGTVLVTVGEQHLEVPLAANETRALTAALPAGERVVRVTIESPTAFRPAEVDPSSSDTRVLGCQVRITLR